MPRPTLYCCILAFFIAAPAFAAEDLTNVAQCMEDKTTNTEWAECNGKEVRAQEATLQQTWQKLDAKYWNRDEGYKALLADQKQWETFKETACEVYRIDFGREGQVLSYPSCKAKLIAQRIDYLNALLLLVTPDSELPH